MQRERTGVWKKTDLKRSTKKGTNQIRKGEKVRQEGKMERQIEAEAERKQVGRHYKQRAEGRPAGCFKFILIRTRASNHGELL